MRQLSGEMSAKILRRREAVFPSAQSFPIVLTACSAFDCTVCLHVTRSDNWVCKNLGIVRSSSSQTASRDCFSPLVTLIPPRTARPLMEPQQSDSKSTGKAPAASSDPPIALRIPAEHWALVSRQLQYVDLKRLARVCKAFKAIFEVS